MRGPSNGPLFSDTIGNAINYATFKLQFDQLVSFVGIPGRVLPHSLWIRAASSMAASGVSDVQIRLIGRWKSASAVSSYIRVPVLQV